MNYDVFFYTHEAFKPEHLKPLNLSGLSTRADERDVFEFFSGRAGVVDGPSIRGFKVSGPPCADFCNFQALGFRDYTEAYGV